MDEFIKAAKNIGNNHLYVQGAGGNASVKIQGKLYIKASGFKLKDMEKGHGYACCAYKPIVNYFSNTKKYSRKDEESYLRLIDKQLLTTETFRKPSMELGFHAVIQSKYVFHLHSVYANIFGCMKHGVYHFKKLCKNISYTIIDYKNPGYELAFLLSKKKHIPSLIFLKNHGIIVHGDKLEDCLALIEMLHQKIEVYLKEKNVYKPFTITQQFKKYKQFSFPDSAVFLHIDIKKLSPQKRKELLEINNAQRYILSMIKALGQQSTFLKDTEVARLLNMQQEKHRLAIFKE